MGGVPRLTALNPVVYAFNREFHQTFVSLMNWGCCPRSSAVGGTVIFSSELVSCCRDASCLKKRLLCLL